MSLTEKDLRITTPVFRVSFPHLFDPQENLQGKMQYSVVGLFKNLDDLAELNKRIDLLIKEKAPRGVPKDFRHPFRDGNEKAHIYGGYADHTFITMTSYNPPQVVSTERDENGKWIPIKDQRSIYPGCYGRASVVPFYYSKMGNTGVSIGLRHFQKVADGELLVGAPPESDFEPLPEENMDKSLEDGIM